MTLAKTDQDFPGFLRKISGISCNLSQDNLGNSWSWDLDFLGMVLEQGYLRIIQGARHGESQVKILQDNPGKSWSWDLDFLGWIWNKDISGQSQDQDSYKSALILLNPGIRILVKILILGHFQGRVSWNYPDFKMRFFIPWLIRSLDIKAQVLFK